MSHTACRLALRSVRRGDGAALRCQYGLGDRWGTLGKVPVGSCRQPRPGRARPGSVRLVCVLLVCLPLLADAPRTRLAVRACAFAAAVDVVLLAGGVLLTRVSTRSAVSRSVNRVATVAR